jgi:membrane-associated protease RseP (regulator of RpoE activity)
MKDGDCGKNFHVEVPPIPNLPDFDIPNMNVVVVHSSMRSGLMVENLTPQLGEFFGAKNGNGVLVRSVEKGSRADKAGLLAGDVITRVGDQPIHDTSDFTHAFRGHGGGSVAVGVIRDKKEQTLTITLPERKESGEMLDETQIDLSQVQEEMAKLRPAMELARQEAREASKEVRKAFRQQQKEMKDQAEELKQEFGPKFREEFEKEREKLQEEMDELREEMCSNFDI